MGFTVFGVKLNELCNFEVNTIFSVQINVFRIFLRIKYLFY